MHDFIYQRKDCFVSPAVGSAYLGGGRSAPWRSTSNYRTFWWIAASSFQELETIFFMVCDLLKEGPSGLSLKSTPQAGDRAITDKPEARSPPQSEGTRTWFHLWNAPPPHLTSEPFWPCCLCLRLCHAQPLHYHSVSLGGLRGICPSVLDESLKRWPSDVNKVCVSGWAKRVTEKMGRGS